MLKSFLETIRAYKELILLVVSLVGGTLFVLDYFATKKEVLVLQCQMQNGIDIIESRINSDDLTKRIVRLKIEVEDGRSELRAARSDPALSELLLSLEAEIRRLEKELDGEETLRRRAADNAAPGGTCENLGRK